MRHHCRSRFTLQKTLAWLVRPIVFPLRQRLHPGATCDPIDVFGGYRRQLGAQQLPERSARATGRAYAAAAMPPYERERQGECGFG